MHCLIEIGQYKLIFALFWSRPRSRPSTSLAATERPQQVPFWSVCDQPEANTETTLRGLKSETDIDWAAHEY